MTPEERDAKIRKIKGQADCPHSKFEKDDWWCCDKCLDGAIGKLIDEAEEWKAQAEQNCGGWILEGDIADRAIKECDALKAQLANQGAELVLAQEGRGLAMTKLAEANAKVAALVGAWHASWDCSSNPGHPLMDDVAGDIPAAARALLDEHARYKQALEDVRDSFHGLAKGAIQHLRNIATRALSTPEAPCKFCGRAPFGRREDGQAICELCAQNSKAEPKKEKP